MVPGTTETCQSFYFSMSSFLSHMLCKYWKDSMFIAHSKIWQSCGKKISHAREPPSSISFFLRIHHPMSRVSENKVSLKVHSQILTLNMGCWIVKILDPEVSLEEVQGELCCMQGLPKHPATFIRFFFLSPDSRSPLPQTQLSLGDDSLWGSSYKLHEN